MSQQTLNGILKFFIGFKCGCLLSQSAIDMVKSGEANEKLGAQAGEEEEKKAAVPTNTEAD